MLSHGQRQLFSLAGVHCRECGREDGGMLSLAEFRNLPYRCLTLCGLREGEGACMKSLGMSWGVTQLTWQAIGSRWRRALAECALDAGRVLGPHRRAI